MANILTAQHIFSIVFLVLAVLQFRFAKNYKNTLAKHGTKDQATFGALTLVGNYVIVIILLVVAYSLSFGPLSH